MLKMSKAQEDLTKSVAQAIANSLPGREFDWRELQEAAQAAMNAQNHFPAQGWPFGVDLTKAPARMHKSTIAAIDSVDSMIFTGCEASYDEETHLYVSGYLQRWSRKMTEARENALMLTKQSDYVECIEVLMKYDGPVYAHVFAGGSHYLAMLVSREEVKQGYDQLLTDLVSRGDTVSYHKAVSVTERDIEDLKESRVTLYDMMAGKAWVGFASFGTDFIRYGGQGPSIEAEILPDQGEYLWEPDETNPSHSPI